MVEKKKKQHPKTFSGAACTGAAGPVLTGAAAGVGTGTGAGLGGWGMVLEAAWEERLSLAEGGEGNRGITGGTTGGTEGFFLLEGGTRGGGSDMGTGSPSRALYTRYMAWGRAITKINDKRQTPINRPVVTLLSFL